MKIIRTATIPLSLDVLLKGQLKFLSRFFTVIGISSNGELLNKLEKREGIKTIAINMERGISPIRDLVSLIKLIRHFRLEKPTIVHSITPKAGLLSMLAAKISGVPIRMHTFTGLIFPTKTGKVQKLLITMDRLLCWAATNVYPEGQGVLRDLKQYQITKKPLKVLANGNVNGIDLQYFHRDDTVLESATRLRSELGIKPNEFVFIFVGRLVGDKGINELVEAFANLLLLPETMHAKLLLVGPFEPEIDPLREDVLNEIHDNEHIIEVGFQNDVRKYFTASNALVFPSHREGFPNVVIQAGAMELPCIVSNINGCNEIILDGINGTIIPKEDVGAITQSMLKYLTDQKYYLSLKENSRSQIINRYEQSIVWNSLLDEYNSLLKNKGII